VANYLERLFGLAGRTALVTGGGRGLGRDFALGLGEAGAHVIVASRKVANCEAVVAEIEALGGSAEPFALDVSDLDSIEAFLAAMDDRGTTIDTLINNAGISWGSMFFDYPMSGWDKVFNLNVRGLFYLSQQVAKRLVDAKKGGVIVNVGSIAGTRGQPDRPSGQPAYHASKAAVHALTKDMAIKLAPHGIRVNAVAPGPFLTDMFNWAKGNDQFEELLNKAVPVGYTGKPDDIKTTALYLCSPACRYLTGQVVCLDGGLTALLANG
jgi:NAD(P)-dependent dehydrogenase (short-subunit alcohol dehydrogenase family)